MRRPGGQRSLKRGTLWAIPCLAAILVLVPRPLAAAEGEEAASPKLPIPSKAEIERWEEALRKKHTVDPARTRPEEAGPLASRLLEVVVQGKEEHPTGRFVLLGQARDLASAAGEASTALRAVDLLARTYAVEGLEMKSRTVTQLARTVRAPRESRALALAALALVYEALARGQHGAASRFVSQAAPLVARAKEPTLTAHLESTRREAAYVSREQRAAAEARKVLEEKPTEPRATLTVGKQLCLIEGEWLRGLEALGASGNAQWGAVAALEQSRPAGAAGWLKLGDLWWDLSEKETGMGRDLLVLQARHWYLMARPGGSTADAKEVRRAGERLARADELLSSLLTEQLGGRGGGPFLDLAPGRAVLVGLRVAPGGVIHGVQPIYHAQDSEVEGRVAGSGGSYQVLARPGYALGGLVVKVGSRLDGFRAVFMRVVAGRLDPGDAYDSEWVGGRGGSLETVLGCTGKAVVGVHGRCGLDIDCLGLVLAP